LAQTAVHIWGFHRHEITDAVVSPLSLTATQVELK